MSLYLLPRKCLIFGLALGLSLSGGLAPKYAFAQEGGVAQASNPEEGEEKNGVAKKRPQAASEVVVTATRTAMERFDAPASISVITSEQLRREPQRSVAEHLQDIPGVQVLDSSSNGPKRITIRGESTSRVLILIDGMKISEQKSMSGSMVMIGPENIERIEVIKGPASVLYGAEAIGGVVNIITKKGGEKPVQGAFSITYDGSTDALTPSASVSGSKNGFGYRIAGDYTDASDRRAASGTLHNTASLERNISAYLDYSWDKAKLALGYDHFWTNMEVMPAFAGTAYVAPGLPKWQRDRFYGIFEVKEISDSLQKVNLTAFTQNMEKDFTNEMRVTMSPAMKMQRDSNTYNEQRSYGSTVQADWTFGTDHYVVMGADYLRDNLDANELTTTQMFMMGMPLPATFIGSKEEAHQESYALFVQDEWNFHPDFTATFGLRHTWVNSALDSTTNPLLDTGSDSDSHLVGSVALVYSGFEDWHLRAQYAQGYKYPYLHQLYIGTVHGGATTLPNRNLEPETSQTFEIGARYAAGGFNLDMATYYTQADDYITTVYLTTPNTQQYTNVQGANTYGAELELSYTYEPWNITPYANVNYMHRVFDYGDFRGETSLTGNPKWSGRTGLRYEKEINEKFSIHADAFLRMAKGSVEGTTSATTGVTTITEEAGWTTYNFAIGARFGESKQYHLDLNLNNITDKEYTTAKNSLEAAGFHAVIRAGMEF